MIMLAALAAWLFALAARMAAALGQVTAVPVLQLPAEVAVIGQVPGVVWSAPAGADAMPTGPPTRARGAPYGVGRT
jgi:hypothetical protein